LTVTLTQATAGVLPVKLAANGSVVAWQEAIVGAEVNGLRVQELKASIGDQVQRGQVLATFATEGVQADVALARAALLEATANATEAAANADRARAVQSSGALSAQQVGQYLTAELTAKARVASAQAQLDAQQLRLKNTQLLAPDAGIITSRTASVGAVLGAGQEMFRLIRQGRLEWRGEVTSAELGRLTAGTPVLVTAPGGALQKGRVRMVSPTVDAQTRSGLVYVDLLGAPAGAKPVPGAFKAGMFARGEFELGNTQALTVAQTAVVVRDGFSYVFRVTPDNRAMQVKVQTGRLLGDQVEVVTGLGADDRVVATGAGFLTDGDLVRVVQALKQKSAVTPASKAQAAIK
jgi:RND family efflux transporter MFP subunit